VLGKVEPRNEFVPGSYRFPHGTISLTSDLIKVIEAWPHLPIKARRAVLALLEDSRAKEARRNAPGKD